MQSILHSLYESAPVNEVWLYLWKFLHFVGNMAIEDFSKATNKQKLHIRMESHDGVVKHANYSQFSMDTSQLFVSFPVAIWFTYIHVMFLAGDFFTTFMFLQYN